MRIARFRNDAGAAVHARWTGDAWTAIEDPYVAFAERRAPADVGDSLHGETLAPSAPLVVIGIAQNGPRHASPVQAWLKSPRTVIASGEAVTLRRDAGTTVAEGEVAVVIGRDTDGLTVANAHEYVLGVSAVNDLSSPDRSSLDPRNFESTSGDGYTPLGPWIDTTADLDDVALTLRVDGALVAEAGSRSLPIAIRECLAYATRWMRLGPGDVVMTGAPVAQAPIAPGAVVEVEVAGMRLVTPTA